MSRSLLPLVVIALLRGMASQAQETPAAAAGAGVLATWSGTRDLAAGGELPLPLPAATALGDFTLTFILELEAGHAGDSATDVLQLIDPQSRPQLNVQAAPSGRVVVKLGNARLDAAAPIISTASQPHQIVVCIRRDAQQPASSLWIDGIERARASVPLGSMKLGGAIVADAGRVLGGRISDFKLYDRALERSEVESLAGGAVSRLRPFEGGQLVLQPDEVIAVIGGTEAHTMADDGGLEALLAIEQPGLRFSLRNLAWESDTVFRQDRPANFGDLAQQLRRVEATCIFLMFGRQECMDGSEAGLEKFREGMAKIIATCQAQTPRLVLLGLPPFDPPDKPKPPALPKPDLTGENPVLGKYNALLQALASESKALFAPVPKLDAARQKKSPITFDGFNISKTGAWQLATSYMALTRRSEPLPSRDELLPLITAIQAKNRLWHDYWRPTNWAALHGDRATQPTPLDPKTRWAPADLEKYLQLIREAEVEIHRIASGGLKLGP